MMATQSLTTAELLAVWERAWCLKPFEQALALLAAATPGASLESLARLPIGCRDARLLTLRQAIFGSRITTLASCPACRTKLELDFHVNDIRVPAMLELDEALQHCTLELPGHAVQFRLPDSLDLAAVADEPDASRRRAALLERVVADVRSGGESVPADRLPPGVVEGVVAELGRRDPQADVELALRCIDCGHRWTTVFDIVSFFWTEIDAWAQRMLGEVDALARTYGWSEADILAMTPTRRQIYLNMAVA